MLMILKQIYSAMGVTEHKSSTDAAPAAESAYQPTHALPASLPFRPPTLRPHLINGSSSSRIAPPLSSSSAVGCPPLASAPAPAATRVDYSPHPAAVSAGQSPAVGPPPKSGFVRK